MTQYKVFTYSTMWSTQKLTNRVERELSKLDSDGWEVISVSFGMDVRGMITAFVTVKR
jgi:hypothetical protein